MISCTEFIPAYSEGFRFLELKGGRQELEKFWSKLSDLYLTDTLSRSIAENGLEGCFNYWAHSLNEEAADFTMILDEIKGEFKIELHKCPSMNLLLQLKHMERYHAYCEHCPALYKPVVEKHGYQYDSDLSHCDKASCTIEIKVRKSE